MLASLLLTAGVGALLGTAGLTIRMVVRGRQAARATQAATTQVEVLRGVAATPPAGCAGLSNGADSSADGMVRRWRIRSAGGLWEVTVVVSTPVAGGQFTDSLITSFRCP